MKYKLQITKSITSGPVWVDVEADNVSQAMAKYWAENPTHFIVGNKEDDEEEINEAVYEAMNNMTIFKSQDIVIKEDFGTIFVEKNVNKRDFNIHQELKQFMINHGFDLKNNNICYANPVWFDEQVDILFKFVHYSVKTMVTEPYYKISFKEA